MGKNQDPPKNQLDMANNQEPLTRLSSGVPGLDLLLEGGLVSDQLYLAVGKPGTGKTLLGMHYLREGLDNGEDVLFIHGEESKKDLLLSGNSVGIDLEDSQFLDIGPESEFFSQSKSYDVVNPQDIEEDRLIAEIREAIERRDPDRALIDPLSQLQYVEPNEYQFRKRIIAFTRFLKDRGTTVMATKTPSIQMDEQLRSLSDGVIALEYEDEGRRISVPKHRIVGQIDGSHGLEIRSDGLEVFPAIRPEIKESVFEPAQIPSNIKGLDALLKGGIENGTVTVISGPSGVGKSTMASEFLQSASSEGDGAMAYLFEESLDTFVHRSETFGIPINQMRDNETLSIEAIQPGSFSPEEFAGQVRKGVQTLKPDLVVIDGIEGYKKSIKGGEEAINLQQRLHALTEYLTNLDITVILTDVRHQITGLPQPTGSNVSYLADNLIFLQYIELEGQLQRIAGVLKKRVGGFENTPRKYKIDANGLDVQSPVTNLHGILDGVPESSGNFPGTD